MKTLRFFVFIFCFLNAHFLCANIREDSFGENADSTKNAGHDFFFYNGLGIGFAEYTGILCDHINFFKGNFVFGASGRISTRKHWRDYYAGYSRYIEYKFV
ncbi:MAG TPA: hypothetical protein VFJ43_09565, partial [Bacteroidia bacterium]|nr:hypothetical protein [Bacteroidia bacterium]